MLWGEIYKEMKSHKGKTEISFISYEARNLSLLKLFLSIWWGEIKNSFGLLFYANNNENKQKQEKQIKNWEHGEIRKWGKNSSSSSSSSSHLFPPSIFTTFFPSHLFLTIAKIGNEERKIRFCGYERDGVTE